MLLKLAGFCALLAVCSAQKVNWFFYDKYSISLKRNSIENAQSQYNLSIYSRWFIRRWSFKSELKKLWLKISKYSDNIIHCLEGPVFWHFVLFPHLFSFAFEFQISARIRNLQKSFCLAVALMMMTLHNLSHTGTNIEPHIIIE